MCAWCCKKLWKFINLYAVCICVYTTKQEIIADLSVTGIANCCVYKVIQTVNSSKPSQPLHPPSYPHTVNSGKQSQPLHPPSCPHTVNSGKPSQPLHPPSCHHTVNSSKPSQILNPPSCPHTVISSNTSQPLHPTSCSHTVQSSKPSQPLHPPSCLRRVNSSKISNHYIHRPALTQLISFHVECSALHSSCNTTVHMLWSVFQITFAVAHFIQAAITLSTCCEVSSR